MKNTPSFSIRLTGLARGGARPLSGLAAILLLSAHSLPAIVANSTAESIGQSKARPQVVVPAVTDRNFGEVFGGEELEHVVMLRNAGNAPLELTDKKLADSRPYGRARYEVVPVALIRRGLNAAPG